MHTPSITINLLAREEGIIPVMLASSGEGDRKITVYQFGDVRVADTNGDPVWEESDTQAWADLMDEAGITL